MKVNFNHYNRMYDALKTIATGYQTPDQLRKSSKGQFDLDYQECLEMAYENIQQLAKEATKGVRKIKTVLTNETEVQVSDTRDDAIIQNDDTIK